jgi:hypothetical protein
MKVARWVSFLLSGSISLVIVFIIPAEKLDFCYFNRDLWIKMNGSIDSFGILRDPLNKSSLFILIQRSILESKDPPFSNEEVDKFIDY